MFLHANIHSKSEKVCGIAFSVKKNCGKVRKSGRHFWAIWGNFGPFWVIFGPFWIILGHSRAILGHLGPFGVIFEPFWVIFGTFSGIFGQICGRFKFFAGSLESGDSLLEFMNPPWEISPIYYIPLKDFIQATRVQWLNSVKPLQNKKSMILIEFPWGHSVWVWAFVFVFVFAKQKVNESDWVSVRARCLSLSLCSINIPCFRESTLISKAMHNY